MFILSVQGLVFLVIGKCIFIMKNQNYAGLGLG